jgi:hypothetical protein
MLQSKQMGRRENKTMNCEGRVAFDLLLVRPATILDSVQFFAFKIVILRCFLPCWLRDVMDALAVLCHPDSWLVGSNSVLDMEDLFFLILKKE